MVSTDLSPTYHGYIGSTKDALLVIHQALNKQLEFVPRRPHEGERPHLIKSGNVFVFIEEQSGIKRWTDGTSWSPSRILGRFLVYRELDKSGLNEMDDKKRKKRKSGSKNQQTRSRGTDHAEPGTRNIRDGEEMTILNPQTQHPFQPVHQAIPSSQNTQDQSRLIPPNTIPASNTYSSADYSKGLLSGPLVTSYVFKDQGLIKKTLSLTTTTSDLHLQKLNEKQTIHLISYYNAQEVMNGKLQRPSDSAFKDVVIPAALWTAVKDSSLGGKIPIEDEAFYFLDGNYQLQSMLQSQVQQQQPQQRQPTATLAANFGGTVLNNNKLSYVKYGQLPQHRQQFQARMGQQSNVTIGPPNHHQTDVAPIKREEDESTPVVGNDLNFINPFAGNQQQLPVYGGSLGLVSNNGGAYNYSIQGQGQGFALSQYNQYLQPNASSVSTQDGYPQHFQSGQHQLQQQSQPQQQQSYGQQQQSGSPIASNPAFQAPLPPGTIPKPSSGVGMSSSPSVSANNPGGDTAAQYRLSSGSSVDQLSVGNNNSVSSVNSSGVYRDSLSNTTSTSSVLTANSSFSVPIGSRKFSQQSSAGQVQTVMSSNYPPVNQSFGTTNSSSNTVTPSASLAGPSTDSAQTLQATSSNEIEPTQARPGQFVGQYSQPLQHHQQHQQHQQQQQQQRPQQPRCQQNQHLHSHQPQSIHHPPMYPYPSPHQQQFQKWSNSPQQNPPPQLQVGGHGNGVANSGFDDGNVAAPEGVPGQHSSYYPTSMQGPRF
ncbi:TOS9 [Candida theae]|uniref:TOS9 n=1 Tax=Candida theae TaxID=1198502 RepID=A0AAD5G0G0_9ASCO|nr:TOS9 [Candida theae]KAI5965521.1 TOS9 [Candida theae]